MFSALLLLVVGIGSRLIDHPHNMVPMCAIALFAAARLPKRWALIVPVAAWLISDVIIDMGHGYPLYLGSRLTSYAYIVGLVALGWLVPRTAGIPLRVGAAVAAQTLFFLVSNFAVWAGGEGFGYPRTLGGLLSTYYAGLPFYQNGLIADVGATLVLFGVMGLIDMVEARHRAGHVTG